MRSEWKNCLLGDIMEFKNGKKRPTVSGKIPVYGGNGILDYTDATNYNNCTIIGRVGAYCGSVYFEKNQCWVSDNAICGKNKPSSDITFDYYLLTSLQLNARHIGTSQPLLTQEILNNINITLPPLPEQKAIAAVLSALDDKIELNNRINKKLEEMAQAIYESWTVSSVGEQVTIDDICSINTSTYSQKENWTSVNYLDTSSILEGAITSIQKFDGRSEKLPSRARRKVKYGDVVFSTVRPNQKHYGLLLNIIPNMLVSTGFAVLTSMAKEVCPELLYLMVTQTSVIEKMQQIAEQSVSTFPSIKPSELGRVEVIKPTEAEGSELSTRLKPLFEQIQANYNENNILAELRNSLLPNFMSGKIIIGG